MWWLLSMAIGAVIAVLGVAFIYSDETGFNYYWIIAIVIGFLMIIIPPLILEFREKKKEKTEDDIS